MQLKKKFQNSKPTHLQKNARGKYQSKNPKNTNKTHQRKQ